MIVRKLWHQLKAIPFLKFARASVLPLLIMLFPLLFYKSRKPDMLHFYNCMVSDLTYRTFYCKLFLLCIIMFHIIYNVVHPGDYSVMLSTVLMFYLFSTRRTMKALQYLRDSYKRMVILFTITLAVLFIPYMFTTSATLALVIQAAIFYPSSQSIAYFEQHHDYNTFIEVIDDLLRVYFK